MGEWTRRYEYTETNVETYVPSLGGVYRLIYHSGDKYYVFYVGESNDLNRRLLQHLSSSEPDPCIRKHLRNYTCYFRYTKVSTQKEREGIEDQQIREYTPTCNG